MNKGKPGEPFYSELCRWHFFLGACLASPEYRQQALPKLGNLAVPQEVMPLCYALEKADGKGVWAEMAQYGITQATDETVCEALLARITTTGKKNQASALATKIAILTAGGEHADALVLSKELNHLIEDLQG